MIELIAFVNVYKQTLKYIITKMLKFVQQSIKSIKSYLF